MSQDHRVEKLMSLTLTEFRATIAPLAGGPLPPDRDCVELEVGGGTVAITYDPRPSVCLGGLLVMPRALVSLTFSNVGPTDQNVFLKRFDFVFQRGGG